MFLCFFVPQTQLQSRNDLWQLPNFCSCTIKFKKLDLRVSLDVQANYLRLKLTVSMTKTDHLDDSSKSVSWWPGNFSVFMSFVPCTIQSHYKQLIIALLYEYTQSGCIRTVSSVLIWFFFYYRLNNEVGHWVTAVWSGCFSAGRAGPKIISPSKLRSFLSFEMPCGLSTLLSGALKEKLYYERSFQCDRGRSGKLLLSLL